MYAVALTKLDCKPFDSVRSAFGVFEMVKAYILIEMAAGNSQNLVEALIGREEILDIVRVTGPYDVIVVIQNKTIEDIARTVADKIHTLPGIVRTTTSISFAWDSY